MTKVKLSEATKIDFTGSASGFEQFSCYGEDVKRRLRKGSGSKVCVVIDRGFAFKDKAPHVVTDHLNLTGTNPLVGPNDPCGERFPAVNSTYIDGACSSIRKGTVAGLKEGIVPSSEDLELIRSFGADFCSYNLVPTMIVAAHAGWKVLGVVIPEGADADTVIQEIAGEN